MSTFARCMVMSGIRLFVFAIVVNAGVTARAETGDCAIYAVHEVSIGSTLRAVRAQLGREGAITSLKRPRGAEADAVEYLLGDTTVYIEYDRRIGKKPEPRVTLLRSSVRSGPEALIALVDRWGPPAVGQQALDGDFAHGPAVWVDWRCDRAVSIYQRGGSWWVGDAGTFVQVESLEAARNGDSPATAAILELISGSVPVPEPSQQPVEIERPAADSRVLVYAVLDSDPPPSTMPPSQEHLEFDPAPDTRPVPAPEPSQEPVELERPAADPPQSTMPPSEAHLDFDLAPDTRPVLVESVAPRYPRGLRRQGIVGHAILVVTVREDGSVGSMRLTEVVPRGRGFEAAAIAAVQQRRYEPATHGGVPVACEITVVIDFN